MKKRQVVLYVVVMLILLTTSVYATLSGELNFRIATSNGNKFYAGDEFTMTIGLKNIEASQGIKSVEGYIDIDENIFENLTVNSIVTNSNGKVQIGNNNELDVFDANNIPSNSEKGVIFNTNPVSEKGDYKIVINLENPISSGTDLVTLNFKIKDNVDAGSYQSVMTYKLFNIFSTDAGEKLQLDQQSYRIDISDKTEVDNNVVNNATEENTIVNNTVNNQENNNITTDTNETTNTPKNNVTNNVSNNAVNNVSNKASNNVVINTSNKVSNNSINNVKSVQNTNNKNTNGGTRSTNKADNTISPTKLPKTGYRLILLPIIAIAIIGFVFYKKYSKYNNYHE